MTPGSVSIGEILGPASFDPKPALDTLKPALLQCYTDARVLAPQLHGKLSLEVKLNEAGAVQDVAGKSGAANDPGLVGCIADALKVTTFPRPGGLATITIPLVFRQ